MVFGFSIIGCLAPFVHGRWLQGEKPAPETGRGGNLFLAKGLKEREPKRRARKARAFAKKIETGRLARGRFAQRIRYIWHGIGGFLPGLGFKAGRGKRPFRVKKKARKARPFRVKKKAPLPSRACLPSSACLQSSSSPTQDI
jgi:hypothetical protein